MKKITLILLTVLLVAAVALLPVIATTAGGAAASEAAGKPGDIVTVTVSLQGFDKVRTLGVSYDVPDGLTLIEYDEEKTPNGTKWLLDDALLADFDYDAQKAAVGFKTAKSFVAETEILQFTFKIDEPAGETLTEAFDIDVEVVVTDNKNVTTTVNTTAKINVSAPATNIVLNKNTMTLDLSGTKQGDLTATLEPVYTTDKAQWASANSNVVSVDQNGKVTAVALGTANVTVTAGDVSASCAVTVICSHANAVETPAKDPTCEDGGNNKYYYCGDCAQYLKADKATATTKEAELLNKLGHNSAYHAEVKATCVAAGNIEYWSCDRCGNNYTDEACTVLCQKVETAINEKNHVGKTELRGATKESCYQEGYSGDTWCLSCEKMITAGATIPANEKHVAATTWTTSETNHWHVCTTSGCPAKLDCAAHTFEWKVDKQPTEDETGLKHEECSVCGYKRNENTSIDKLPHQHIGITHYPAVAATCKAEGNKEYWTCASSKCTGKFFSDAKCEKEHEGSVVLAVDSKNHVGGTELKNAKAANCYQAGYSGDTYCKGCNVITVPGVEIPATGKHVAASAWKTNDTHHWHACTTSGCPAEVNKAEHKYQWKIDKKATEYVTGLKHEECECGLKRNENTVIPKLDHVHRDIVHHVAVAATCVKTGTVEYWTCGSNLCDNKYYGDADCQTQLDTIVEKINPNNHVGGTELKNAKAANCYQAGYTGDTHCKSCGVKTVSGKVINATGKHVADKVWHTDGDYHWHVCTTNGCNAVVGKAVHVFQWKIDKKATEYVSGLKHEECACGYKRNEGTVIPKLDHVHRDIKHHAAVAATCVKTGTVEYWTCGSNLCDGKYYADAKCKTQLTTIVEAINPAKHTGGTKVKEKLAPTCSEAGYSGDTYCASCDKLLTKGTTVPATGNHTPGKTYVTDGKQHWKVCTHCDAKVGAANHDLEWIVDSYPTEEVAGKKHQKCAVCAYTCNEGTAIEKLEHKPVLVAGKVNTCTEDGVAEHYFCDNCDRYFASANGTVGAQIKVEDTVLKATGHSYAEEWSTDAEAHWHVCHCGDQVDKAAHEGVVTGALEASKNEPGYTGDTVCSVCEYVMATGEVIPSKQDAVLDSIENATNGGSVDVVVPNDDGTVDAKLPAEVLESAKGKDVQLVLNMGKYLWKISGDKIMAAGQALDLTVKLDQNKIPADVIEKLAGEAFTQQLSFAHSGDLGFTADLEVALDQACAGKTGNVYCYNENKELELVATSQVGADGKIMLSLDKAADYVIVVSENAPAQMPVILWVVIAAAAVAIVAVVIVLIVKKKKNR